MSKRLATISVPMDLFGEVLLGRARVIGFPEDARFVRASYDLPHDAIEFLLEHPSFQEVAPNEMAPELQLMVDYTIVPTP